MHTTTAAVEVTALHKRYGEKVAVQDVSFTVRQGEVFGILGPNGAGKTTTVEAIAGLRRGDAGRVRVHGIDPWTDRAALTKVLGIQLQEAQLPEKITVSEAFELWSALYDDPVPWPGLADNLGLGEHVDRRFGKLSGGQQQRLSIGLALVGNPRVAVLDELSTGLDPRARREVWQIVRDLRTRGVTVLLVTHAMDEAQELCDRIAIVQHGRIAALDTPDALIRATSSATVTTFRAEVAVDLQALRELATVSEVRSEVGRIVVQGTEDAAVQVIDELHRQGVRPRDLRVVEGNLDTAYLDLTATATATAAAAESTDDVEEIR
ncbi:ABC transporter ATP-binding protein [Nocardioides insulae]|uniref:ABC transporter ATP-binding protein n=1 Tax=Nocardioides insulae TaxID=394734 RepID=UPI00041A9ECB|nr:ABC transporter ATP-binding protein [Nocardioides insulae]